MKYRLMVFAVALTAGIGFGCSEEITEKIARYFHNDCVRWDETTLERPLFTLSEAKLLLGKKVHDKHSPVYQNNSGRIRRLEMIGQDKFFVLIDWKIAPDDGQESLRLYDKKDLAKLSVED